MKSSDLILVCFNLTQSGRGLWQYLNPKLIPWEYIWNWSFLVWISLFAIRFSLILQKIGGGGENRKEPCLFLINDYIEPKFQCRQCRFNPKQTMVRFRARKFLQTSEGTGFSRFRLWPLDHTGTRVGSNQNGRSMFRNPRRVRFGAKSGASVAFNAI